MSEHLPESAHPGQIDIAGSRSPVTYRLKAEKEDNGGYHIAVSLTAPRDWLLKQGFRHEATLLRQGGDRVRVRFDSDLNVADNVSVTLTGDDETIASQEELDLRFPELRH